MILYKPQFYRTYGTNSILLALCDPKPSDCFPSTNVDLQYGSFISFVLAFFHTH